MGLHLFEGCWQHVPAAPGGAGRRTLCEASDNASPSALGCPNKAAHSLTCSTNRMFLRFRQKTPLSNDRP